MNYEVIAYWSQIAGFILFAIAFVWAIKKWMVPGMAAAQKASNERIALAERHRDEMQQSLVALREQIEAAKRDADAMKVRVADRVEIEKKAIIAEATESGERALKSAGGELDRRRSVARVALREQLASKALEIARGEAAAKLDASANAKLLDEFVGSIERGGRA
ncbi:MAG: hypothetical protein KGN02_08630 [bacterium]|nr:hypothetical protein [bacterium]